MGASLEILRGLMVKHRRQKMRQLRRYGGHFLQVLTWAFAIWSTSWHCRDYQGARGSSLVRVSDEEGWSGYRVSSSRDGDIGLDNETFSVPLLIGLPLKGADLRVLNYLRAVGRAMEDYSRYFMRDGQELQVQIMECESLRAQSLWAASMKVFVTEANWESGVLRYSLEYVPNKARSGGGMPELETKVVIDPLLSCKDGVVPSAPLCGDSEEVCEAAKYIKTGMIVLQSVLDDLWLRREGVWKFSGGGGMDEIKWMDKLIDERLPLNMPIEKNWNPVDGAESEVYVLGPLTIEEQIFPHEAVRVSYLSDMGIYRLLLLYMYLALLPVFNLVVQDISYERENGFAEQLRLLGTPELIYELAQLCFYGLSAAVLGLPLIGALCSDNLFGFGAVFFVGLMVCLYVISLVCAGLVSVAIAQDDYSTSVHTIVFYGLVNVISIIATTEGFEELPLIIRGALNLLSCVPLARAVSKVVEMKSFGGISIEMMSKPMGKEWVMQCLLMVVDCCLYFLLAVGIQRCRANGITSIEELWVAGKKRWLNLRNMRLNKRVYRLKKLKDKGSAVVSGVDYAIDLQDLVKVYKLSFSEERCRAVDGLSLKIRRGEIFALLGHNGAGKSTILRMILGLTAPTSGNITVLGYKIPEQVGRIRCQVAMCAQQDRFAEDLTLREHLELACAIRSSKGTSNYGRNLEEGYRLVERFQLGRKLDEFPLQFSGGEQRAVGIVFAMIGSPAIVILDEPTSGLDPLSRRRVWSVLQEIKSPEQTIILTTHYVEEADYIAERKAILSHGRISCVGNSLQLRSAFKVGYNLELQIVRRKACPEQVLGLVKEVAPLSTIKSRHAVQEERGECHVLVISLSGCSKDVVEEICALLEGLQDSHGGVDFGLSLCTLDDIFESLDECAPSNAQEAELCLFRSVKDVNKSLSRRLRSCVEKNRLRLAPTVRSPSMLFYDQAMGLISYHVYRMLNSKFFIALELLFPLVLSCIGLWRNAQTLLSSNALVNVGGAFELFPMDFGASLGLERALIPLTFGYGSDLGPGEELAYGLARELGDCVDLLNVSEGGMGGRSGYGGRNGPQVPKRYNMPNRENLKTWLYSREHKALEKIPFALSFDSALYRSLHVTIFWNPAYPHVLPASFALLTQTLSRLGGTISVGKDSIMYSSRPLTSFLQHSGQSSQVVNAVQFATCQSINSVMIPLGYAHQISSDQDGPLQYLKTLGLTPSAYWLATAAVHGVFVTISMGAIWLMHALLLNSLLSGFPLLAFGISLFLFGLAILVYGYCLSIIVFPNKFHLLTFGPTLTQILSALPSMVVILLMNIDLVEWAKTIDIWCARLSPPYTLISSLIFILDTTAHAKTSNQPILWKHVSYGNPNVFNAWISSICHIIFGLALLVILETRRLGRKGPSLLSKVALLNFKRGRRTICDDKVERSLGSSPRPRDRVVIVKNVHHVYTTNCKLVRNEIQGSPHHALAGVNFAIGSEEIFGLLGPNGAGKSTLIKALTATAISTEGELSINRFQLPMQSIKAFSALTYCPQQDLAIDFMSIRQLSLVLCRVKGLSGYEAHAQTDSIMDLLNLSGHQHKSVAELSGGLRRRFVSGITLLLPSSVAILDEPTNGMDLASRNHFKTLIKLVRYNRCILLTTHSMDEADALCTRVAILVRGRIRILGPPTQLKFTAASYYRLLVYFIPSASSMALDRFLQFLQGYYPDVVLVEGVFPKMHLTLPVRPRVRLSRVFQLMRLHHSRLDIAEWSLSQPTVEDIFIKFAELEAS